MWEEFEPLIDHRGLASGRDRFRPQSAKTLGVPSFSFAETDFKIPRHMQQAFRRLIDRGFCGYTVADDPTYLQAIVSWMKKRRNWEVQQEWIIPVYGVLRTMSMALRAVSRPGEGVIIFSPGYTAYEGLIEENGRSLVRCSLRIGLDRFLIDWDDLEKKMSVPQNTMLFLCNAHNPTMHVWPQEDLRRIAVLSQKYNVAVIVDETFADLCFPESPMTNYGAIAYGQPHCMIINALSKAFNITGLNAANAILPDEQMRRRFMEVFRAEQRGSGSIEPFAREAILSGYSDEGFAWLQRLFAYVKENFTLTEQFFAEQMPQVKIYHYDCAYLIWTDWRTLGLSEAELEHFLMEEAVFCVDMGYKYGPEGQGFARIHLGTSHANVQAGLQRLEQAACRRGWISTEGARTK